MRGVSDHSLRPLSDVAEHESPSVIGQPAHHERYHHRPWRGGGEERGGGGGENNKNREKQEVWKRGERTYARDLSAEGALNTDCLLCHQLTLSSDHSVSQESETKHT